MTGVDFKDEDADFMKYLADNGWKGEVGEDKDKVWMVGEDQERRESEADMSDNVK